ncbi:MAG: four helix bundle protein [Candidatus Hydrogenedentes bacterium]|nr:four helix bundle protein [Candidatus Hydrogenedentota bacterium]
MDSIDELLPKHGGYRKLKSFQISRLIYDITVRFCDRYISVYSGTHNQMVQAARSGVQNIAEGSQASGTSKKSELKLTNVARASLEELRLDYEDFLRQHNLAKWDAFDPRNSGLIARRPNTADEFAAWARDVREGTSGALSPVPGANATSRRTTKSQPTYPEITANGVLALITVACSLLNRQLAAQSKSFVKDGGFTERLHRTRTNARNKQPE